jgi:hypothetical protein
VLLFIRGTSTTTVDSTTPPKECLKQVEDLKAAVKKLAGSNRIVVPDAAQDAAIADFRYQKAADAFEALKQVVDAPTLKFLNQLEPELQQITSKFEEIKKTPEYTFIRMIFNNTAEAAANATELLPNKAEFALKVTELGYNPKNTTYLKYLIDYANEIDSFDISIGIYKQLFQKMKENKQLLGPETFLLFYCLDLDFKEEEFGRQSEEIKEEYFQFSQIITKYKDDRVKSMVADIGNFTPSKFREMGEGFSDNVLSFFLPEIILKYYTPPIPRKVANLIEIFKGLPYNDNDCVAIDILYHELSKHNQEETFEAFALLMYTKFVMFEAGGYEQVDEENKQKCSYVLEALSEFKDKYINKYAKLIGRKEWSTLRYWHTTYDISMRTLLPEVIEKFYTGNKDNISYVTELTANLPYLEDDCVIHEKLFSTVLEFRQENTFEALEELASLRASFQYAKDNEMTQKYLNKCKRVKEQAPEWIRHLLWSDTRSCKITNRKFKDESLVVSDNTINNSELAGFEAVYTLKDADLKWNLTVDKDGLTSFEGGPDIFILHNNVVNKPFSSKDGVPDETSNDWYLEHAYGDYVYIYTERTHENGM